MMESERSEANSCTGERQLFTTAPLSVQKGEVARRLL